ncbi:MAG TPA: tetratricopeptide repeat protein, partial [Syntrophobacteraceae bacterium]|nr:tetratricopeptide repeat protein [Syntrophobacteraceae bacterium]
EVGEKDHRDAFSGFLNLLGRNNLRCEIACRVFLRDWIRQRSPKDLLEDGVFLKRMEDLFVEGNDAARYALLRLQGDLTGYGCDEFKYQFSDRIIAHFMPGEYWFEEVLKTTQALRDQRLDLFLERLKSPDSAHCINHLRAYYLVSGIRLCRVDLARFNSGFGLELLRKSQELLESMTVDDLLASSCNDPAFAQYRLNALKRSFFNDYAISCRRAGRIDNAIQGYEQALQFNRELAAAEPNPFFKDRILSSIGTNSHNLAYVLSMKGSFAESVELYTRAIEIRAASRKKSAVTVSLNLLNDLFDDVRLPKIPRYLTYFVYCLRDPQTDKDRIINLRTFLGFLLDNSELDRAQDVLTQLVSLHMKNKESHIDQFRIEKDYMRVSLAKKEGGEAAKHLEAALAVLDQHQEENTFSASGRSYFEFWEKAAQIFLLNEEFAKSDEVITNRLEAWIARYG